MHFRILHGCRAIRRQVSTEKRSQHDGVTVTNINIKAATEWRRSNGLSHFSGRPLIEVSAPEEEKRSTTAILGFAASRVTTVRTSTMMPLLAFLSWLSHQRQQASHRILKRASLRSHTRTLTPPATQVSLLQRQNARLATVDDLEDAPFVFDASIGSLIENAAHLTVALS